MHEIAPLGEVSFLRIEPQVLEHELVYVLGFKGEWQFVDVGDIACANDCALFHVAEGGDLAAHLAGQRAFGAAEQDVRLDADGEHLLDGVLRGLGLELLSCGDPRDKRDVDEEGVIASQVLAHLADGFEEGQRLDVADGAADLDDADVALGGDLALGVLDLVRDMRDDLDGLAEVVAAALLRDDLLVDARPLVRLLSRESFAWVNRS